MLQKAQEQATADIVFVIVARPFMYGLTVGGEEGVEEVLRMILADTEITLGLSGYRSLKEIQGQREKVIVKIT